MARVTPPSGYATWNAYIEHSVNGITDINQRRMIKRDIKLGMIAHVERYANGVTTSNSYRSHNVYNTPGTVSPTLSHPWALGGIGPYPYMDAFWFQQNL